MFKKKEKNIHIADIKQEETAPFYENRKTVKELIAPNGANPNPYDYMVVNDGGVPLYTMCFSVDKLPKKVTFASTFAPLFDFPEITTNVFINPLTPAKSTKKLDKRIVTLDTERIEAEKDGNRNRIRKISTKMADAERYAIDVESGDNKLYEVQIMCTVQAVTMDQLLMCISDLQARVRNKGVELAACYSVHPEAFVSGYTTNRVFKATSGLIRSNVVKTHIFDKGALACIFNHTHSAFSHRNGIPIGRNMFTDKVTLYDAFDPSHNGYSIVVCGKTGTGKSVLIKVMIQRYIDFGYHFVSIDYERKGSRGEYYQCAEVVAGVNYQISQNSDNILNIFELEPEEGYDEATGREFLTLNLSQKIVDASNLIMIMVKNGAPIKDFDDFSALKRIITDTVSELYEERGIQESDVESLYKSGTTLTNGKLSSGKVRKVMPTITDFYKRIILKAKVNKTELHNKSFQLLIDNMKDYVKELYYCPDEAVFFERQDYENAEDVKTLIGIEKLCPTCKKAHLVKVRGVKSYFDGQSNIKVDTDIPHVNFDLSQLLETERKVAMNVVESYVLEQFIKKNSLNPKKARKLVVIQDEAQKTFDDEDSRKLRSDVSNTARKRNVSQWIITQALENFSQYKETRMMLKQSTSMFLLKQDITEKDFIRSATPLTETEIETLVSLGGDPNDDADQDERKGEVCLIDNGKVAFLKVDYLKKSEALAVETDMQKLKKLYEEIEKGAK